MAAVEADKGRDQFSGAPTWGPQVLTGGTRAFSPEDFFTLTPLPTCPA